MIDAKRILQETYPDFKFNKDNKWVISGLKKLIHEDDLNEFLFKNQHLRGFAFLDKLLTYFKFTYQVDNDSYLNIPAQGRLLIVANHPIGTLDGLALVKLIRSVRPDVRVVVNRVLVNMKPLESIFFPVNILSSDKKELKDTYKTMIDALEKEEAIIIFPAGEVSRITPKGVRDGEWQSGFIKLAKKTKSPILPIHIKAKNSAFFYGISTIYKPLATMLLVNEMFNKRNQTIKFQVGSVVPYSEISETDETNKQLCKRFRKHVLNLGKKNKTPLFKTVETVIHPVDVKAVKKALYQSHLLGETRDGKKIFLYEFQDDCPVMREIARLRELTFRTVEEGTGLSLDMDRFDVYYRQIVLWDDNDLEIVGAYRLGEGNKIMQTHGVEGFYTNTLFELQGDFVDLLPNSIELGRSFVQPRYWGQHSLDYLWYGIGAYLRERPDIKYLFGPVSISNAYPDPAKDLIIRFYQQQFGQNSPHAKARTPYVISDERGFGLNDFTHDYSSSYKILNSELKKLGVKVPTLYKQYSELCIEGGCHFIDFNVDADFNDCIDGLIMVEIDKITPKKKQRYIEKLLA
ncbi:MAG: lysophospholipid acyltransferase family protein [Methylococcaceae bacterium]